MWSNVKAGSVVLIPLDASHEAECPTFGTLLHIAVDKVLRQRTVGSAIMARVMDVVHKISPDGCTVLTVGTDDDVGLAKLLGRSTGEEERSGCPDEDANNLAVSQPLQMNQEPNLGGPRSQKKSPVDDVSFSAFEAHTYPGTQGCSDTFTTTKMLLASL
jgi:hypothetical protein